MGKYLPDKISALDKATWKKAREEAGFEATLFGGPAIGSKLDEFKKMKAKCKPLGDELDIKRVAAYINAAQSLQGALMDYHKKASKETKKQNLDFAAELKVLADKMQKKIIKGLERHKEITKLYDKVTDGKFTERNEAVNGLMKDLLVDW